MAGCRDQPPAAAPLTAEIDRALARAGAFVIARPAGDGAFRDSGYAAFRDGRSLTPLALAALRFVPGDAAAASYRRGGWPSSTGRHRSAWSSASLPTPSWRRR